MTKKWKNNIKNISWFIPHDGDIKIISPENKRNFVLEELRNLIQGSKTIDIQYMPSGLCMVLDDNGKLINSPYNKIASAVWRLEFPIKKYPLNNDETIVGNVVVCHKRFIK